MGKLTYLVIHCLDTPENMVVTKAMLKDWHMSPKPRGRGWDRLGYSDVIHRTGVVENVTPYNENDTVESDEITWGVTGVNSISRHIALEGGKGDNPTKVFGKMFTLAQATSLVEYVKKFLKKHPTVKVAGHYNFAKKACPNFDVYKFFIQNGINPKNLVK
jgi:N-acetylmuramoyl-L-alanine amidase